MATYKVIQDIEAEDKLLGPLTLRQFVYAAITLVMGFIAFKLAIVNPFLVIPFLPPMIFFGMLAAPFGHDQSSEVWLLAKIRFFLKPRRRIWNQTGLQELVTITVPKPVEKHLTDGLSQTEIKSRLQALASTIDSRGWAVKNVNVNLSSQPSYLDQTAAASDRLVDSSSMPQEVPAYEVYASDDILDEANNPTAQHLDAMIGQSEQAHRQTLLATVQGGQPATGQPVTNWFMNQATGQGQSAVADTDQPMSDTEKKLLEQIHRDQKKPNPAYGHMRVLNPKGSKVSGVQSTKPDQKQQNSGHPTHEQKQQSKNSELTAQNSQLGDGKAVIARLAANDDLNVATLAREAKKAAPQSFDDEVIISLR